VSLALVEVQPFFQKTWVVEHHASSRPAVFASWDSFLHPAVCLVESLLLGVDAAFVGSSLLVEVGPAA
jgi:hypothetical protein